MPVLEYYDAGSDHYFITADPNEIAYLNLYMPQWQRTGAVFFAYPAAFLAPPGAQPVCRFYAGGLIGSHFFTAKGAECAFVQSRWAGVWTLENPAVFYIEVPDSNGACRDGTIPIHRFFNNRQDANHRHTPDLSGEARDGQPQLGAGRRERRRVLLADLTFRIKPCADPRRGIDDDQTCRQIRWRHDTISRRSACRMRRLRPSWTVTSLRNA